MKSVLYLPLFYIGIYIAIPLLAYLYWGDVVFSTYNINTDAIMLMAAALFTCLYFFIVSFFGLAIKPIFFRSLGFVYRLPVIILCVVLYFPLALIFYSEYGSTFRHHGVGMLEAGLLVFALYILKVYCFFAIFVLRMYGTKSCRWLILAIGITGLLSFMTSLDIIHIIVCFFLFFKPDMESSRSRGSLISIFKILSVGLLVLLGGIITKAGLDISGYLEHVDDLFIYFVSRFSVHFISLANIINDLALWIPNSLDATVFELQRTIYRVLSLAGFEQAPLEPANIARMNAVEIYYNPRDITGASPGPAALALLAPPLFLGFIFRVFIDGLCMAYIGSILKDFRLGLIVLSFFSIFLTLLSANLLLLNPLQPSAVILTFLIISASRIEQMRRQ